MRFSPSVRLRQVVSLPTSSLGERNNCSARGGAAALAVLEYLTFSPDGRTLAVGDGNGATYLWNIAARHLTAILADASIEGVGAVAYSPDGRMLATADQDGNTYLWKVASGR